MQELEEETRRAGPTAVARAEALKAQYGLAAELILLRKRRGLTQRQLSARTGIQQSEISRIEVGRDRGNARGAGARARRGAADRSRAGKEGDVGPHLRGPHRSRADCRAAPRVSRGAPVRCVRAPCYSKRRSISAISSKSFPRNASQRSRAPGPPRR